MDKIVLIRRKQRVLFNGMSEEKSATSGVPQGSVLGPTLFLKYINDIVDFVLCNTIMFADDLLIFQVLENHNFIANFQRNLDKLEE